MIRHNFTLDLSSPSSPVKSILEAASEFMRLNMMRASILEISSVDWVAVQDALRIAPVPWLEVLESKQLEARMACLATPEEV